MVLSIKIRSKSYLHHLLLISIFFSSTFTVIGKSHASDKRQYLGLRLQSAQQHGIPLFTKQPETWLSIAGPSRSLLNLYPRSFKRTVEIDSSGQHVFINESMFDIPVHVPAKYSLKEYTDYCRRENIALLWQTYKTRTISGERFDERGRGGIEIAIPVRIKSRAFQTIFGGDRVSLSVTGQININGGLRHESHSQVRDAYNRGSNYNFKMQQTQNFKVQGNVGDKVTVSVDQDSERPFDFENTVKLNYDGYDDEIIQSIQAGNISLSLPGTRFVSFSAQNSGLFGIKSQAQIGNFHLTTIASQEKGENKTLSITGGAEEGEYIIKDYNYMEGVYFLIDSSYVEEYDKITKDGIREYDQDSVITNFEIYKSGPGYEQKEGRIRGWALLNPASKDTSAENRNSENEFGFWIRLEQQKDYFLWTDLGKIKLNVPVSDNEMLAVAYKKKGAKQPVGDVFFDPQTQSTIFLKMLKPRTPRPSDKTWKLMLRNVYYLGGRNIDPDGFELKIFFDTPSGNDDETIQIDEKVRSFLYVFGLDRADLNGTVGNPDNVVDDNPNFIRLGEGELEFPRLKPFEDFPAFPGGPNLDSLDSDKLVTKMYSSTIQSEIANDSKFYIQVKSKNRSANYDLGFNVIEGSEEVTLNGQRLMKDTDYIIDYFSGKLTILREEATNPSANVEVNYQRNEMFQLEKKTLLGMRGEYKFWENSFIGGTFLYLNQSTLDQKVRVGKGPMRNLIWDLNTSLKFEPNFLTKAIDAFPIIETKQPSRFNFEGEIAQILPNPNTLNNTSTQDPVGVAYIDDFEAAKKITPLGVIRNGWRESSSPLEIGKIPDPTSGWTTTFNVYMKRGRLLWWNPYEQVAIKEIWPNRDTHNPNTPQRVHVLGINFTPVKKDRLPDAPDYQEQQSWGGIMRWLSAGYADQSDSKFLEIWVKREKGMGKLHIDLGQISEDIIPNGELDTEDIPLNGIRNNVLDAGEDVGIDGMKGEDPTDFWDINNNDSLDTGEPISYDNWEYSTGSYDYDHINGTEGNERDPGGRFPDTEDFNGNGSLDMRNDFFRYTFILEDSTYIAGGQDNKYGWRMYRIPLNDFKQKFGDPDFSRIEFARIWIDSCSSETQLKIAEINLVGNDWKEMGVAGPQDEDNYNPELDTIVVAAVTNTHDNDDYIAPPGVRGVIDRVYRIESKEQSLVIKINGLKPGANGILRKTFFQAENYIHYKKMKMFVHGGDASGAGFSHDKTSIELFLRFGSDDNNYFEFRQMVFEGWEGNEMEIDLDAIAALKQNIAKIDSVTGIIDSTFADSTKHYRIKGKPALTNIRQLVLGVKNSSDSDSKYSTYSPDFYGEIWVNELRLSGVRKDKGFAYRARAELQVADVFSINGEINQRAADFHNISERFGRGNNETSGNLSGNISLHKFLPKSWGLSLPINFNYSQREATPKYLPGSDILYKSALKETKDESRSASRSWGWGTSFKKNTRSNNFFIKNTIDQISVSYNTAESRDTSSTHKYSTRSTHAANISYSIPFPRDKSIRPFKWLGKAPIIKKLAELQFFYLPSNFSVRASGNKSTSAAKTRSGVVTDNRQFIISRSFQTGIQPFKSFTIDFSRSYKNDLRNLPTPVSTLLNFQSLFSQNIGDSTNLTDMDQSFSTKYNPQLFRWLTTSFNYSTNFKFSNNLQLKDRGRSASNNSSLTGSFKFDPDQLIKSIFKQSSRGQTPRTRTKPSARRPTEKKEQPAEKESEEKKQEQKKKPAINPFKAVLSSVQFFTSRIQPISLNYTNRKNLSQYGLDPSGAIKFPTLDYMFGFSDTTGMPSVASVGTNTGSNRKSNNISLSSGIKLLKQMDMSLKFNRDNNRSETTTITGDLSESWFFVESGGDSNKNKQGFPIPEWSFRWTGLEQVKFIKKFVQRMSLDHNFSGRKQESWKDSPGNLTRVSYSKQFRPLAGLNIGLKKKITVNIRYNRSEDVNFTMTGGSGGTNISSGGQKNTSSDISISGSWSHSGGFRLPLPFLKNKELKNNIDVQVTFSWNKNASFQQLRDKDWTETRYTESLNFEPRMTYSFSRNVRGGMNFKIGKNSNKTIGETTIKEFGIHVSIIISGR